MVAIENIMKHIAKNGEHYFRIDIQRVAIQDIMNKVIIDKDVYIYR
jgi:hypothetical protein